MARCRDEVSYAVSARITSDGQLELWRELCARLEDVAADSRYAEICASGDGVPARTWR